MTNDTFSRLFVQLRYKAKIDSLTKLGNMLGERGWLYEDSILSHWQHGRRIPNRNTLIEIIRIFFDQKQNITIFEANELLEAAGQGYLTEKESWIVFGSKTMIRQKIQNFASRSIETKKDDFFIIHGSVENIISTINEDYVSLYLEIYKHPLFVYKAINNIINLVECKYPEKNEKLLSLTTKLKTLQVRSLTDICGLKQFTQAKKFSNDVISFAKIYNPDVLGFQYWADAALKRLEYASTNNFAKNDLSHLLEELEFASRRTPQNAFVDRFVQVLESAKVCLLLKNESLFEKYMLKAESYLTNVSTPYRFLETTLWDFRARGTLRFKHDLSLATRYIMNAKKCFNPEFVSMGLGVLNTEAHIYREAKDISSSEKLTAVCFKIEYLNGVLNNPYQKIRFTRNEDFKGI